MPLELDFPPRPLHPNARPNRFKKNKVAQKYKNDCFLLTRNAMILGKLKLPETEKIGLQLTFIPPSTKGPVGDDDGMEAAFKSGRDGLALALKIDDKRFVTSRTVLPRDPSRRFGAVLVQLTAIQS